MTECIIVAVGSRHDSGLADRIADYEKRLSRSFNIRWQLIPYSQQSGDVARRTESDAIRSKLKNEDIVVLLDERGTELTSEAFAGKLEQWSLSGKRLIMIIGGAYGVDAALRQQADFTWSLSKLVFPHQIVRLLLIEQIYRATTISAGHPYHH